ncbi:MAG: putative metal-dependent hydrolase of the TIM-barrel fold protein [Candidatus Accumulibacter appositus]|uniref:Putative metal-dependent hydrolase of the TIM-barrel fold protein n=1 Tax=Candidatus Accumulibacter appositus TaxID=1454003 RepID=A0A011ND37_9PROT|nr:amidohydrolase family protein [Accumulibacter sp.]EXI80593.1 MAG: putative metal-dependent hydrolase of the TIM-barrel fold protein [Candidatus Accumulibacter appositus]HRF05626.1 amidohydrolase family protein [Accumulibacter sp.]
MNRRWFLGAAALSFATGAAWWGRDWLPLRGLRNLCLAPALPDRLAEHPLVRDVLLGLDPAKLWDCHVHLLGTGDSDPAKVWVNPALDSVWHPSQFLQKRLYSNAACVDDSVGGDASFLERLASLTAPHSGMHLMLLAFDYNHGLDGRRRPELSTFFVANEYTRSVAARRANWEWICSVHPYRDDALEALEWAAANGARAVKWLPPAMGMDPASPRCDRFYQTLQRLKLPLLTHAGHELAAEGGGHQDYGDPRRLRRPLEHGVRVIVAHCASLGESADSGEGGGVSRGLRNFQAFLAMMREPAHEKLLFGDLSAVTQINRAPEALQTLLLAEDLHHRLLNGSDYPLTGIVPLFSLYQLQRLGLLEARTAQVIAEIQHHNPLLFDLVLKRNLLWKGHRFPRQVFETADFFLSNDHHG